MSAASRARNKKRPTQYTRRGGFHGWNLRKLSTDELVDRAGRVYRDDPTGIRYLRTDATLAVKGTR